MPLRTITVKVDEGLRRRMSSIEINWSELKAGKHAVPRGFINRTIREIR